MNKRQERYKAIEKIENEIKDIIGQNLKNLFQEVSRSLKDNENWTSESDKMKRKIYRKTLKNYWRN